MSPRTLAIEGLRRGFGHREVIRGLTLYVGSGERVALRGPNGSGKSTVLRCVAGTLTPSAGVIAVCGFAAGSVEARASLGCSLSLERSFYLRLSGRENLHFYARVRGASRREARRAVEDLEQELQLTHILEERTDRLSTGMFQQLGFARSLIGRPALLVLDEPTRSLDEAAVMRFWAALERRLQAAVILATHRPEDIDRCGRVIDLPS